MSFSAEINDFVAGFTAGSRIGGDIQDRKMQREKWEFEKAFKQDAADRANRALDLREKGMGISAKNRADAKAEREAAKAEREAAKAEKTRARRANELLPDEPKSSKPKAAETQYEDGYDFDDGFGDTSYDDTYDESALPTYEVDDEEVALAAEGGLIEDDEDQESEKTDLEPASAIPTEMPKPASVTEPEVNRSGKGDSLFKEAANVTRDVMDQWNNELKEKPEAISANPKKDQSRVSTVQPASPEAIKAIDAKIDPNNEMEPYRKGAARLVEAYNFFVEKGDVEKARKIAGEIIKFNRAASMTLGQLALAALDSGDLQAASKLVADAYDQVPDGGKAEAQPTPKGTIAFKIDREGYARQQGEIGARDLWGLASKVADGSAFLERMTALAAEGTPTSGSNNPAGGKGKKRGSYTADVAAAAKARKIYDTLNDRYESMLDGGATEEEVAALKKQVSDAAKAYTTAREKAQRAAEKTKRPPSVLEKDFKAQLGAVALDPAELEPAIPDEAPVDDRGVWQRNAPYWLGGRDAPTAAPAPEEALPTQPAPAPAAAPAAPAATSGRPIPPALAAKIDEAKRAGATDQEIEAVLKQFGFR